LHEPALRSARPSTCASSLDATAGPRAGRATCATRATVQIRPERASHWAPAETTAVARQASVSALARSTLGLSDRPAKASPFGRTAACWGRRAETTWCACGGSAQASELRFGRYDPDAGDGDDLLQISATVNALATLIAAHETAPPLSVGLFGPWGSGKTFFLRKLRTRVEEITEDAGASALRQADL
jgi:KAP-like P-loop domain-containing protein